GIAGHQAAIYVSGVKNSSAGDNDGIQSGYGLYVNSEMTGTSKILGVETDDITGGKLADTEAFYVRADGVIKGYGGSSIPSLTENGEFGFYRSGGTNRIYWRANGQTAYVNRSGTVADYSEFFKTRDLTLHEDWGTVVVTDNEGSEMKVLRSNTYKDKNVLGVVSEGGTRYNDDEEGMRHEDPNYVNIAMLGQLPVKVTNQNGPIAVGDYLTTSSVIGHAMKADPGDPILGIAMEAFSGTVNSSEGKINCLLSRNNQGNISTLLKDLQERKTLTAEEVLAVINNESFAVNYLVMTKGEVMEGLKVHGELELDRQNIGSAVVLSGEQRVRVYFPERFRVKPIVTVSPELTTDNDIFFDFQYLLYDVNADGFSIKLNQPLDYDLRFNWQAFAQADYSDSFEIDIPAATPVSQTQLLVSFDCREDNLSACVTARDCWQFADIAKWTGSACVLK
ncbi:MAG TPA: H-type lectin domain-containing protein, partial [bacterium]|nr:H-type lectin domain-containing protein [bacterium]